MNKRAFSSKVEQEIQKEKRKKVKKRIFIESYRVARFLKLGLMRAVKSLEPSELEV